MIDSDDLLSTFCDEVIQVCSGNYNDVKNDEHRLFTKARKCFKDLLENIAEETKEFTNPYKDNPEAQTSGVVMQPTGTKRPADCSWDPSYVDKIQKVTEDNRGGELPGFMNYNVFKTLVQDIIKEHYIKHADVCLNEVEDLVDEIFGSVAENTFGQFPKLHAEVKARMNTLRHGAKETSNKRIEEVFQMEQLVFTQDRIFDHDLVNFQQNHLAIGNQQQKQVTSGQTQITVGLFGQSTSLNCKALELSNCTGHQITCPSANQKEEIKMRKAQAKDMYNMIKAYLEVSARRIVDYIPLTIQLHLIKQLSEDVKSHILTMATDPKTLELMVECYNTYQERRSNQHKLQRLYKADTELATI